MKNAMCKSTSPGKDLGDEPDRDPAGPAGRRDRKGLLRQWSPAPGIELCVVHIPVFLRRYLPGVEYDGKLAKPPVSLSAFSARPWFLSSGEFDGVGRYRSLKKQVEWICGRLAAKCVVASMCHDCPPLDTIELAYRSQGAPYVATRPDLPVSISHSGSLAGAVSTIRAGIGFDLERIRPWALAHILPVAFSSAERRALSRAEAETVFRHWTLKEAYLKLIGKGFNESLKAVEILYGRLHHRGRPVGGVAAIQGFIDKDHLFSLIAALHSPFSHFGAA